MPTQLWDSIGLTIHSGYNLCLPILTYAVINIVGLLMIYFNLDTGLYIFFWKENK